MPVSEDLTQSQGLLADLKKLQRRVSEQLAEKETEFRGLNGTDTRLDELQHTLDGLQPEPGRWREERQALMDRRDELSRAVAEAEARWKQTLEAATQNGRQLQDELEKARALVLQAQQELTQKDAARQAHQAGTAKERERNATVLRRAQEQLDALRSDKQRQDEELTALISRVGSLEQEIEQAKAARESQAADAARDAQWDADQDETRRATLDGSSEEFRRQLAMVDALRAEQQRLTADRAALVERVTQLERAVEASPSVDTVEESWKTERTELLNQLVQLEQALHQTEGQTAAERDQLTADLTQARLQLTEVSQRASEWQTLEAERSQLQARLQSLEQGWMAREAAIAEERIAWQQQVQRLTGSSATAPAPMAQLTAPATPTAQLAERGRLLRLFHRKPRRTA